MRASVMRSRKVIVILAAIVALVLGLTLTIIVLRRGPTITGYKDEGLRIYECGQPIKAKKGTVPMLFGGRVEALVPADQTEAAKYCQVVGIE